jgi:hypothetical protein
VCETADSDHSGLPARLLTEMSTLSCTKNLAFLAECFNIFWGVGSVDVAAQFVHILWRLLQVEQDESGLGTTSVFFLETD